MTSSFQDGASPLVPVGAGVVMGWVGTLVVARVSIDGRMKGDRKGCRLPRRPSPTPHPNLSRPYEDEAASQACLQKPTGVREARRLEAKTGDF